MPRAGRPPVRVLPPETLARARAIRRNESDSERKLWRLLHSRRLGGAKFRRNHPIGLYFAYFCCIKARSVIELDGGQHAEDAQIAHDWRRTTYLQSLGYKGVRSWNQEVLLEPERVLEQIYELLMVAKDSEPSP
jgi:very-short-patch-repair endonuclease